MDNFQLVSWAIFPPLLLLVYYYRRIRLGAMYELSLNLTQVLLFFGIGVVAGLAALGWQWGFEFLVNSVVDWERITRSLPGAALRQLVEVGPIEEGTKFGSVFLFQFLAGHHYSSPLVRSTQRSSLRNVSPRELAVTKSQRSRSKSPSTLFLATIAVALGFTAEENWVYLANGTASVLDRLIGTPVHALFSAPWGYALGIASRSAFPILGSGELIARYWVSAVACHALVNVLSIAWRYPALQFLSYGLFPFLLWMFWRLEALLRRVLRQPPIALITGRTRLHRYWERGLVLFALMLGGNAIFGLFLLERSLNRLSPFEVFYSFALNLVFGIIAWAIYRYLRSSAGRRI